jgi:hypothetical protein
MKDLFDFSAGSYRKEDVILRFILRLGLVIFVLGVESIILVAMVRLFIK